MGFLTGTGADGFEHFPSLHIAGGAAAAFPLHSHRGSHEQGNFASPSPLVIDPDPLHSSQHFFAGSGFGSFFAATTANAASAPNAPQSLTPIAESIANTSTVFITALL